MPKRRVNWNSWKLATPRWRWSTFVLWRNGELHRRNENVRRKR